MIKYRSLEKAYSAPYKDYLLAFGPDIATRFDRFRRSFDPLEKIRELTQKGIQIITPEDAYYPAIFIQLKDMPICLYVKGQIENYSSGQDTYVAVVGTRKSSDYGEYLAKRFASALAKAGCVVVSGMAIGIDSEAHEAALAVGGRTIAFLGCGVDIIYPPSNKALYEKIIRSGGLVISEFPPGMTVVKGLFRARNRLISGIAKTVLVVEGTKDSGALITARYALDQGKDVFILPVPLNSQLSEAPIALLKEGGQMLTSPDQLLAYLHFDSSLQESTIDFSRLTLPERDVMELISYSPRSIDELTRKLQRSIIQNLEILSSLELRGLIIKNSEGKYTIKH